jgi:hypothetical protein
LTRILQILLLVASLLIVIIAGYAFEEFIRTVGAHFSIAIGGKRLPEIFEWLAGRRGLIQLLMLLPWFALVGLPLLTDAGVRRYWEPGSFALRYLAFLTAELFLVLMFFFCVSTTFSAIYLSLLHHHSGPDLPLGWIVVVLTGLLTVGAVVRIGQRRSSLSE